MHLLQQQKNFTWLHLRCAKISCFFVYTKKKRTLPILHIYICCTNLGQIKILNFWINQLQRDKGKFSTCKEKWFPAPFAATSCMPAQLLSVIAAKTIVGYFWLLLLSLTFCDIHWSSFMFFEFLKNISLTVLDNLWHYLMFFDFLCRTLMTCNYFWLPLIWWWCFKQTILQNFKNSKIQLFLSGKESSFCGCCKQKIFFFSVLLV